MLSKAKELYLAARDHAGFQRYFKNTSWLFGGQMFRMVLALFVSIAVARYLGPEDFGLYSYVMSVVALFSVLGRLGLRDLARRELVVSPEQRNEILGTCFMLNLTAGVFIYGAMIWIVSVKMDSSMTIGLFALLGCPLLLTPLSDIKIWFQSQVRSDLSVLASSISLAIFAILKVVAIVQGAGLIVFGYLFLFESLSLCLLHIYFYQKNFGSIFQWQVHRNTAFVFLRQSWPLILSGFAVVVYMKMDQIMLEAMHGHEAVGQYSVAVRISSAWHFIPMMLASSLFPAILNARKNSQKLYEKRLQNFFDLNAVLAYLIAISLSIAAPWMIQILFGEAYRDAGPILSIHAWSCLFVFLGVVRGQYLVAEKLFKFATCCTIAGAIVNLSLNYVLIPGYSGYGAAIATLISYAVSAFLSSYFIKGRKLMLRQQVCALLVPLKVFKYIKDREFKN